MARILLIDSDQNHASALRLFLERQRYSVSHCACRTDVVNELLRNASAFDFVVLDLTGERREAWEAFERLRRLTKFNWEKPDLICLCRGYRGPQLRMRVERLGARLVYERQL
jgi:DNA-binding response OmpR family regulator